MQKLEVKLLPEMMGLGVAATEAVEVKAAAGDDSIGTMVRADSVDDGVGTVVTADDPQAALHVPSPRTLTLSSVLLKTSTEFPGFGRSGE